MIHETLRFLVEQLRAANSLPSGEDFVVAGNVARADSDAAAQNEGVVATVVNIEEEKTLKNGSPYARIAEDQINRRNPTIYLNIYVLFSCSSATYLTALERVSAVIGFFQRKNLFTRAEGEAFPANVERIGVDLFSPSFEQVNHLWGVLGGKYLPSVLYRVRMVGIQTAANEDQAVVRNIRTDEAPMPERAAGG